MAGSLTIFPFIHGYLPMGWVNQMKFTVVGVGPQ